MQLPSAPYHPGRRRRPALAGLCVLVVVAALVQGLAGPAAAATTPMTASQVTTMWTAYGDAGGHWTGGDSTVSVPLPDGRVAWLFSDTFLGTVNADHSRPHGVPFIHNCLVVQDGSQLVQTLTGGTSSVPTSLVSDSTGDMYWLGDATVDGSVLHVLYGKYHATGTGPFDFTLTGTALATFALPGLTLSSVVTLPVGATIGWGSAILKDGSYTYIYGTEGVGNLKFAHLARATSGNLGGAWQYWTGSTWSAQESDSARLFSGVGSAYSVNKGPRMNNLPV